MLFQFIAIFALFGNNAFTAAQTQSSCRFTTVGEDEECGTLSVVMDSPLSGGRAALREEMRWQAGIYSKLMQPFMQVCAGSLVSSKVVISAAHCFWSEVKQQLPASDFAVGLGKLYRPWNDPEDENAQKSDIRDIRIPPRYHGSTTNYQDDIALLVLATPMQINAYVLPVCLDFDYALDTKQLTDGNLGKVAGWGRTDENGKPSPILQVLNLPVVDINRCYDTIEPTFRPALTSDKICAGRTTEGTAVCVGDSGGGLAFPENSTDGERYYLRGIVSTAPKSVNENLCNIYTYGTFTHIAKHEQFIREVMSEASKPAPVLQVTTLSIIDPNAPPIPDITSLPLASELGLFRPLGEVIAGGRSKPLNKGKSKKKFGKNDGIKTGESSDSDKSKKTQDTVADGVDQTERTQDTENNVTETSPPKSEGTDADAVLTIQVVEEPSVTQTGLSQKDTDNDYVSQTKPKDDQADADYTVQIIEEPIQPKPSKPQADTDAEAEYTVQIIQEPTVTTDSTNTDQSTEKRPFLSISSEPFLSTGTKSSQTDTSIDNQQISTTGNQPDSTADNQPDKPIEQQPIQSVSSNQADQSIVNKPSQPISNQPSQTLSNQAAQSWNQLPLSVWNQPAPTVANQFPLDTGSQPAQATETQLPQTTGNLPSQPTSNQAQFILTKPIKPFGNQLPGQSTGNQASQFGQKVQTENPVPLSPSQSSNQRAQTTENPSTTGNQPNSTADNQPDKPIEQQPIQSVSSNQADQSIVNKPSQPIGNQPSQTLSNQAAQSWNQLPLSVWNQPAPTVANQFPLDTGSQPAQATETQLPQTTGNLPSQPTSNQAQFILTKPIKPFGNQLPGQSTGNQASQFGQKVQTENPVPLSPVQSSNQRAQTTENPSVVSIWNKPVKSIEQSGIALGVTGNQQPVYFAQTTPSSCTTHKNPDITYVNHKWNSDYHHQYPYDFHHGHYHHHHDGHYHGHHHHDTGHHYDYHHDYHHENPHYHKQNQYQHDWHNYHHQW